MRQISTVSEFNLNLVVCFILKFNSCFTALQQEFDNIRTKGMIEQLDILLPEHTVKIFQSQFDTWERKP